VAGCLKCHRIGSNEMFPKPSVQRGVPVLRVVLDTSLFVNGLLVREGPPAQLLDAWRRRRYLLVVSPAMIAEVRAALDYSWIRLKYHLTAEHVAQMVTLLEQDALVVPGEGNSAGSIPDDPQDERILACALEAQADLIVSGDRHLLDLQAYRGIPVIGVGAFLERLATHQGRE